MTDLLSALRQARPDAVLHCHAPELNPAGAMKLRRKDARLLHQLLDSDGDTLPAQQNELSANVRGVLTEPEPLRDGRARWIQSRSVADIKRLLSIKHQPRTAKGDKP